MISGETFLGRESMYYAGRTKALNSLNWSGSCQTVNCLRFILIDRLIVLRCKLPMMSGDAFSYIKKECAMQMKEERRDTRSVI